MIPEYFCGDGQWVGQWTKKIPMGNGSAMATEWYAWPYGSPISPKRYPYVGGVTGGPGQCIPKVEYTMCHRRDLNSRAYVWGDLR